MPEIVIIIMNALNSYSGFSMFMVTLSLAIITLVYVIHTKRLAEQAKKQVFLIVLSTKVAQHRELCEKVYSNVKEWLMPFCNIKDFFGKFQYFGVEEWKVFRNKLPYFVYQLDKEYMESILKINTAIDDFKNLEFTSKIKSKIEIFIIDVFCKSLSINTSEIKIGRVMVRELGYPGQANIIQNIINLFCLEDLMGIFLKKCKVSRKVYWKLLDGVGRNRVLFLSDNKDDESFQSLDLNKFEFVLNEVFEQIKNNKDFNSWVGLVRLVVHETERLIANLEMEMSRNDESIAKKFNIYM
jgi:hypothetical protein